MPIYSPMPSQARNHGLIGSASFWDIDFLSTFNKVAPQPVNQRTLEIFGRCHIFERFLCQKWQIRSGSELLKGKRTRFAMNVAFSLSSSSTSICSFYSRGNCCLLFRPTARCAIFESF
jgi:hypothetical protein